MGKSSRLSTSLSTTPTTANFIWHLGSYCSVEFPIGHFCVLAHFTNFFGGAIKVAHIGLASSARQASRASMVQWLAFSMLGSLILSTSLAQAPNILASTLTLTVA